MFGGDDFFNNCTSMYYVIVGCTLSNFSVADSNGKQNTEKAGTIECLGDIYKCVSVE